MLCHWDQLEIGDILSSRGQLQRLQTYQSPASASLPGTRIIGPNHHSWLPWEAVKGLPYICQTSSTASCKPCEWLTRQTAPSLLWGILPLFLHQFISYMNDTWIISLRALCDGLSTPRVGRWGLSALCVPVLMTCCWLVSLPPLGKKASADFTKALPPIWFEWLQPAVSPLWFMKMSHTFCVTLEKRK